MMDNQDREILGEFVSESREHLADIESDLLAMEKAGDDVDDELINRVFRAIHTVKGASGFFGLQKIAKLSHAMENLLMKIRDRELPITSERIDALLNASDILKGMIDDVDNSESFEIDEAIAVLEASLNEQETPKAQKGEKIPPPEPARADTLQETGKQLPPPVIAAASRKGPASLYQFVMNESAIAIAFEKEKDGETLRDVLSQTGEVIFSTPDLATIRRGNFPYPSSVEVFYLTILEPDVIGLTFGLNDKDIQLITFPEKSTAGGNKEIPPEEKGAAPAVEPSQETKGNGPPPKQKPELGEKKPSSRPKKRAQPQTQQETIRVNVRLLTRLMDLAGELVLGRNQLMQTLKDKDRDLPILHTLSQRVTELQEHVMQTRMQPVGNVFNKFPRIVRDMSKKVNKKIKLIIEGDEVELDRSIIEVISDPLTHLIRNSVDHGIEPPEERVTAGKEAEGTIWLRAYQEGGQVNIEIQDDGKGIDPEVIRAKATEKRLIKPEEAKNMSNKELVNLIFLPGFSTAEKISDISGRGVGMDVVKTNFEKFGGVVEVNSEKGKGTIVTVRLPLTLAIIPSIITKVGDHRFAVPQVNLEEIVRVKGENEKTRIERVKGYEVLRLRGHLLSLVRLADVLKIPRTFVHPQTEEVLPDRRINIADRRNGEPLSPEVKERRALKDRRTHSQVLNILVLKLGGGRYGLIVDQVLDTEEIVVKPLSSYLKSIACFSGTTIMGDGKVAMILDVQGIARTANLKLADIEEISKVEEENLTRKGMMEKQYVLLFSVNENEAFALPMSMVARLEKIEVKDIETVGEREFIQLRGTSLPLVRLERFLSVKPPDKEHKALFVIVPRMSRHPIGIIATQVIDVLETTIELDTESMREKGFLGTIIIAGRTMPMLDLFTLFETIDPEQKEIVASISHAGKPARILLVEDTPFFMKLTRSYLESAGHEVLEATDGAKALAILHKEPVDLVISDIEMPVMDGYELIQNLRKDENLREIPAMALTALSDERHRSKGLGIGFDDYEIKIDKTRVLTKVHKLLTKKRQASAA